MSLQVERCTAKIHCLWTSHRPIESIRIGVRIARNRLQYRNSIESVYYTRFRASDSMFLFIDFVRVTNCFYDYDYDYEKTILKQEIVQTSEIPNNVK